MKVEETTDTMAKLFNDLIGAWVPGSIPTAGLAVMHVGPLQIQAIFKLGDRRLAGRSRLGADSLPARG